MQLLLGLEKVDLNSTWFRSSLLIRYWGRMGPATPGIPPFGFKGSPMLLAKAGIKEMTEGKKPNNQQQQKTQLLPCPLPAPPPPEIFVHSPSAPPGSHTPQGGSEGSHPLSHPPPHLFKKGAQSSHQPPPHLTCGCSPSPPPCTARHRPTAIPEPPFSTAGLTMAGDAGRQRVLAAVPGTAHIWPVPASSIHHRASAGVIRLSF